MSQMHFPGPDSLCETCGYALRGLSCDGDCPECGESITGSSPTLRIGPGTLFKTVRDLVIRPKLFFRNMRIDGPNTRARGFLAKVVVLVGLFWLFWDYWFVLVGSKDALEIALADAIIVMGSIYLLSYIEALGVVFFSRKRNWRVPFRLAERLVCYASIGWIPAAVVMGWALAHFQDGSLDRWMRQLMGTWALWQSVELLVLIGAVALMGFEVLVWIGVRQTKFANSYLRSRG